MEEILIVKNWEWAWCNIHTGMPIPFEPKGNVYPPEEYELRYIQLGMLWLHRICWGIVEKRTISKWVSDEVSLQKSWLECTDCGKHFQETEWK